MRVALPARLVRGSARPPGCLRPLLPRHCGVHAGQARATSRRRRWRSLHMFRLGAEIMP